jgi:hypothetical protein
VGYSIQIYTPRPLHHCKTNKPPLCNYRIPQRDNAVLSVSIRALVSKPSGTNMICWWISIYCRVPAHDSCALPAGLDLAVYLSFLQLPLPFIAQSISQLRNLHTLMLWDLANLGMDHIMQLQALRTLDLDLRTSSVGERQSLLPFPGFHHLSFSL